MRSRSPHAWSRPSTSGRSSRTPAWARPARWPTCAPIGPRCGRARRSRTSRVTASRSWSACLQKKFTRSGSPAPGPTAATTPATPPTTRRCSPSSPASPSASSTCATTRPAGIRRDRRASIAAVPASMRRATSSPTTSSPGASRGKTWRRTRAIPRTRWPASSPACRPGRRSSSRCRPRRTSSPTSAAVGSASRRSSTAARRSAPGTCAIRSGPRPTSPASRSSTRSPTPPAWIRLPSG